MERVLETWLQPDLAVAGAPGGSAAACLPDPVSDSLGLLFFLIIVEVVASQRAQRRGGKQRYNLPMGYRWAQAKGFPCLAGAVSGKSSLHTQAALQPCHCKPGTSPAPGIFTKALHIFPYIWLHRRISLLPSTDGAASGPGQGCAGGVGGINWQWWLLNAAALLVAVCGFYWQHRAMHATNLGWAAHLVHHSSPDFNLSTALRQGAGESTFSWLFCLPLALFCPPRGYALHRGLNTVYQFFTHTELVGRLWWPLELVLNTPSHHRVHHARNYGRRNFAGVLIVWDRAFGTFEPEHPGRPCIYGLNAQRVVQGTYNPLWHQMHHAAATLRLATASKVPAWRALLTRQYGPGMVRPSTTDAEPAEPAEALSAAEHAGPPAGSTHSGAAWAQPVVTGAAAAAPARQAGARPDGCLLSGACCSPAGVILGAGCAAWGVTTAAWLCGGQPLAVKHELARLAAQALLAAGLLRWGLLPLPTGLAAPAAGAFIALSAASAAFLAGQLCVGHTANPGEAAPRAAGGAAKKVD